MADQQFIYLSDLLNSLSVSELQQLKSQTETRLQQRLGRGTRIASRNPAVNQILSRSPSLLEQEVAAALQRLGIDPTIASGYHDTNPNNPFKDYNKSIDDHTLPDWNPRITLPPNRPEIVIPPRGGTPLDPFASGYHDTNPNNPFKDYNKSTDTGYHDTNPNNPFKDHNASTDLIDPNIITPADPLERFRELVEGGQLVTMTDFQELSAKLEGLTAALEQLQGTGGDSQDS